MRRKKVLFVVEALTFAHVARSAVLAKSLQSLNYDVHFACRLAEHRNKVANELQRITVWPLTNHVSYSDFVLRMSQGRSPYSLELLNAYVDEETSLIRKIDPDIVIGDLRYSLSISCPKTAKPYVNLVNAIWSPFTQQKYVVPQGPLTRLLGPQLASLIFDFSHKKAFQSICHPFNQLRLEYGLAPFKDIFEMHCAGDLNLYPDPEPLFNTTSLPPNHQFIGPVLHSLSGELPEPLSIASKMKGSLPVVFASVGSSGSIDCLPNILECLEQMPLRPVVATCGRTNLACKRQTTILRDFLPARDVIRMSSLVISNGGSPISYLAMSEGVPVIAVCSNMDQHLTAQALANYGAAISLRAESVTQPALRESIQGMLADGHYRDRAKLLAAHIAGADTLFNFRSAIERALTDCDKSASQNVARCMPLSRTISSLK